MKSSLSFLLIFIILHFAQGADLWPRPDECGKLNLDNFYKSTNVTALDEYPWVARVGYEASKENNFDGMTYRCLAVLISRRYLLTAAHCVIRKGPTVDHVLLGDWNPENEPNEVDCDKSGKCAPLPKKYEVSEVVVYPDNHARDNDIALLRLSTDVTFSDYIRPLCMPPKSKDATDFTGQLLPYVGFNVDWNESRVKTFLHIFSYKRCKEAMEPFRLRTFDKIICGTPSAQMPLISGSPVMAANMVDGELHSLYLLGIVTGGDSDPGTAVPDLFMRVSSFRNWIEYNVVQ